MKGIILHFDSENKKRFVDYFVLSLDVYLLENQKRSDIGSGILREVWRILLKEFYKI